MFRHLHILMILSAACSASPSTENSQVADANVDMSDAATSGDSSNKPKACDSSTVVASGTTEHAIEHDGLTRTFRVHVPPGYAPGNPSPVVLMFHGGGGSGQQIEENSSQMNEVADRENFIVVYPDGTGMIRTWNGGGCCGAAVRNDVDDVGFVEAMLDSLDASLCVDHNRIYASGMSNGGIFSHRLACELSERIAAIAPVAGTMMMESCAPSRKVAVMQIHGSEDGHVPWDGGEGCGIAGVPFTSVPKTISDWRTRNGCSENAAVSLTQGDGRCESFEACPDGANVILCSIEGGGHSWPGGVLRQGVLNCPEDGHQSTTFGASEAMWNFFKTQSRTDEN